MREDLRRRILARRAAFIAAAVAGATTNCNRCNPLVCLEPPAIDAGPPADAAPGTGDAATKLP